jgi:hypothetical protein
MKPRISLGVFAIYLLCEAVAMLPACVPNLPVQPPSGILAAASMFVAAAASALVYRCRHAGCSRVFKSPCHLGRHQRAQAHGSQHPPVAKKRRRCSYTFRRKRDTLLELDDLIASNLYDFPMSVLADRLGINKSELSRWNKQRDRIFALARSSGTSRLRKLREDGGQYPMAEADLYGEFLWRRRYLRRKTTKQWLRMRMRYIVLSRYTYAPCSAFKASEGWCTNFCNRWRISSQCRTNKHKQSVTERLPQIRKFHQWLIYGLQRSEPERCPKYGRFPPNRMFHMDQVPLPFSPGSDRTLNMIGEACEMLQPGGSSSTKRFCTLQVTICAEADGEQPNIEIYFRTAGKRLSAAERTLYASLPNVNIRWQPKAWCDERIAMEWLEYFRGATIELGEILLGMDNHSAQCTAQCRAFMEMMGIVPAYTPPNCTDCTSPVDCNVGQTIKLKIAKLYDADYSKHPDQWELPKREGGLSDSAKRMLVAQWVSTAWQDVATNHKHLIRSSFVKTGFLLAKDGSENHLVQLWKKRRGTPHSVGPNGEIYNF